MVHIKGTVAEIEQALKVMASKSPIKIIFAADYDIELQPKKSARLYNDWNKTVVMPNRFNKPFYNFIIVNLPLMTGHGIMIPVYWNGLIVWLDPDEWIQKVRLMVVNDQYNAAIHFIGDKGVWPGATPVARQVKPFETVEVFGETESHYCISPYGNEWIDKNFLWDVP